MLNKIKKYMVESNMLTDCSGIVVGLSGGADSVCLFLVLDEICREHRIGLFPVHVHHGIRGEEADYDLEFCRKLCQKKGYELLTFYYDVPGYAKEQGITAEEAGRHLRYKTFGEVAQSKQADRIAVAHHMNDQAETVLFNMCRGSSIRGIRGMLPVRDNIIRPLLCCTRAEIENYLKLCGQDYCTDSTNTHNDYSRNHIRNVILPYLTENINSGSVENIAALADRARAAEEYLEKITFQKFQEAAVVEESAVLLKGLDKEDNYIAKRIILMALGQLTKSFKDIGESHIDRVAALIGAGSGTIADIRQGLEACRQQDGIYIYRRLEKNCEAPKAVTVNFPSDIEPWSGAGRFVFSIISWSGEEKISNDLYTKYFDYDKIKGNVRLRTREPGDFITVDADGHRKKLKQYFIDEKLPSRERDSQIILADGQSVMWVVGRRIGAEYKVSKDTVKVLKVEYFN